MFYQNFRGGGIRFALFILLLSIQAQGILTAQAPVYRPRAKDFGLVVGILPAGPLDAITDVAGVAVGHTTIIRGENVQPVSRPFFLTPATCIGKRCRGLCSSATPSASLPVRPR